MYSIPRPFATGVLGHPHDGGRGLDHRDQGQPVSDRDRGGCGLRDVGDAIPRLPVPRRVSGVGMM